MSLVYFQAEPFLFAFFVLSPLPHKAQKLNAADCHTTGNQNAAVRHSFIQKQGVQPTYDIKEESFERHEAGKIATRKRLKSTPLLFIFEC